MPPPAAAPGPCPTGAPRSTLPSTFFRAPARLRAPLIAGLALLLVAALPSAAVADVFVDADFDLGDEGFVYVDDAFRGTNAPGYADGAHEPGGGETGGGLRVDLGNVDDADVTSGMSGAFRVDFTLPQTTAPVRIAFRYQLTQSATYESNELSQVMASVDGAPLPGVGPDFIAQINGDGNFGLPITTGWVGYEHEIAQLPGGTYRLLIGGYNNQKTLANESTTILIDDVRVEGDLVIECTSDPECDDANPCTDDACGGSGACLHLPNAAPCDDGVACTGGDVCSGGTCGGADLCLGEASCNAATATCEELAARTLVDALSLQRFKDHIQLLSSPTGPTGGSRYWSRPGNESALDYIEAELASYGYTVERHAFSYSGTTKENVYATRVGSERPDRMMIVSAHMDSYNRESAGHVFAPGANDDASGTSLVLEAARVFSDPELTLESSVRFVLWNNEEVGLVGSSRYVSDRRALQGIESPPGSGRYPEPVWMGVIQHDMMLWDHGLPSGPTQIPEADNDIEYQASSAFAAQSLALANLVAQANVDYAPAYPGEVSDDMCCTDSVPFEDDVAAISVRENRRRAEIGNGSDPNWHANSDVFETYSEADFALGFNALQATVGAVAEIVNARQPTRCGDGAVDPEEQCDDGNGLPGDCCSPFCAIEPVGTTCRPASDVCDVADVCDGITPACPADVVAPAGTSCRPAAGVCDLEETCDGETTSCPGDLKSTAECRPVAGLCDQAERCDGAGDDCPADAFLPASFECRPALGPCDSAEACTGLSALCPDDAVLDGVVCEDADACTPVDLCTAGVCVGTGALDCDDGDACTADACDAANGCVHTPIEGCVPPAPVPAGSGPARFVLFALLVAAAGALALRLDESAPGA